MFRFLFCCYFKYELMYKNVGKKSRIICILMCKYIKFMRCFKIFVNFKQDLVTKEDYAIQV